MATTSPVPRFVRFANILITSLLRAGVKVVGFGAPTYLLTVRGRTSGQPRTTPVSLVAQDGQHYLFAPYGVVDWVRNLRAAETASLTRGGRVEQIHARELPPHEAGPVLKRFIASGNPIGRFFDITRTSSAEEFAQATIEHPVFVVQRTVER